MKAEDPWMMDDNSSRDPTSEELAQLSARLQGLRTADEGMTWRQAYERVKGKGEFEGFFTPGY